MARSALLAVLALGLALGAPAAAESLEALDRLLAETLVENDAQPPAVPPWLEVALSAPSPPILGEPFRMDARVLALAADLPAARFAWKLPRGMKMVTGEVSGPLPLVRGQPRVRTWIAIADEPLGIVEGQIALAVTARMPREALLRQSSALPPAAAARLEAEIRRQAATPQSVMARLEVAVNGREGFLGFSPLVWGTYLRGDGFYLGAGSFMDTNFAAHDLVADAERQLLADAPREALALLARARADLRPGAEADPLLRWEAANCEAIAQFLLGKKDQARELWRHALRDVLIGDVRRYAHYNLGEADRRDGKAAEARRHFAEACRIKPAFRVACQKSAAPR